MGLWKDSRGDGLSIGTYKAAPIPEFKAKPEPLETLKAEDRRG